MKVKASRRSFLRSIIAGTVCVVSSTGFAWGQAGTAQRPPNVILIVVDDLGWSDVGCNGAKFYETPHIDKLASQGVRFTNAYASGPMCSPTRAALMTGKFPARLGLTNVPNEWSTREKLMKPAPTLQNLPITERTIGQTMKSAGYTTGIIGKWHLGMGPDHKASARGFDVDIGTEVRGPDYWQFYMDGGLAGKRGDFLQDKLTDHAVDFMRDHAAGPFFLYFPMYAVHRPVMAKPEWVKHFQEKYESLPEERKHDAQTVVTYAALIASADEAVGRILSTLHELGLDENTMVILTSDNGGLEPVSPNDPLRAGKGSCYEGGLRVPAIVRYTGVITPGSTTDTVVDSCDWFTTVNSVGGVDFPPGTPTDGQNLLPVLTGKAPTQRDTFYWHFPHYHQGAPAGAIRQGKWKLVELFEDGSLELFDLEKDIGESSNLVTDQPELARKLHEELVAWRASVGAKMPTRLDQIVPVEK